MMVVAAASLAACGLSAVGASSDVTDGDGDRDGGGPGTPVVTPEAGGPPDHVADARDVEDVTIPEDAPADTSPPVPRLTCNGTPCEGGTVCCFKAGGTASCRDCNLTTEFRLDCAKGGDCAAGQSCCLDIATGIAQCKADCGTARTLCSEDDEDDEDQGCRDNDCGEVRCGDRPAPFGVCKSGQQQTTRDCKL